MIIDIAISGDARVENKELEKLTKYRDLAVETSHLWKKHTSVVPIVIGALGTISRNFTQYYKQLQISEITPSELQKRQYKEQHTVYTASIFNRYLGFWLKLVSVI